MVEMTHGWAIKAMGTVAIDLTDQRKHSERRRISNLREGVMGGKRVEMALTTR